MRLPRNLSGSELAGVLRRTYGYEVTRQRGSHMRLTSTSQGYEHNVTIPNHSSLRVGTLSQILGDVANYLGIGQDQLVLELFYG